MTNDEVNQLVATVFRTRAGKKLIGVLRERYIERASFVPGQDASLGYYREGQNDIVRSLIAAIEAAKDEG